MRKTFFILLAFALFSCKKENQESFKEPDTTEETPIVKSPETLGKEIFENKGNCVTCHAIDTKLAAPSLKDIAKIYKEKKGNIVLFLKGEAQPIVDPSQFEIMKTNFAITEEMSDEQLKALEAYIFQIYK